MNKKRLWSVRSLQGCLGAVPLLLGAFFLWPDDLSAASAWWEPLTRTSDVPMPLVMVGLMVLAVSIHLIVRLNHQLRREIRNRWYAEDKLSESQQRLALALWGADIGCWDWNLDKGELFLDQRSAALLGVEAGEGVLSLNDSHRACELFRNLRPKLVQEAAGYHLEQVVNINDRWLQITGKRLTHGNTQFRALGTLMDVSQAHTYRQQLEELSTTDPLTGVFNRRHFFERMPPACAQARRDDSPLAVAMLDIDHFKQLNDEHGHLVGDEALIHFATQLKRYCRPYDLVARYGGEEFVVLFVGIDRYQAQTVLSRYREALVATPLKVNGASLTCYFSAGIADLCEANKPDRGCEELVGLADARLYQAKRAGRDRIFID